MSDPIESKEPDIASSQGKGGFKPNQKMVSDIVLLLALVLIISMVRVYVGGSQWVILVWKGEITFKDTVVNLQDLLLMPRSELTQSHPKLINQLEEMDLIEPLDLHAVRIKRLRLKRRLAKERQAEQDKKDEKAGSADEKSSDQPNKGEQQSGTPPKPKD